MSEALVLKLLESFDELERCICETKEVLSKKTGVPADVMVRVDQYLDIVTKQRELAAGLKGHLGEQNWDEVARHVKLINGLSGMIRDDAQAIISGVFRATDVQKNSELV